MITAKKFTRSLLWTGAFLGYSVSSFLNNAVQGDWFWALMWLALVVWSVYSLIRERAAAITLLTMLEFDKFSAAVEDWLDEEEEKEKDV